jgi:hypothetical protein
MALAFFGCATGMPCPRICLVASPLQHLHLLNLVPVSHDKSKLIAILSMNQGGHLPGRRATKTSGMSGFIQELFHG